MLLGIHRNTSFLGHIISKGEAWMDPSKISAIKEWPKPTRVIALRGLLGLMGYYRKFNKNYGKLMAPLRSVEKE